MTAPVSPVSRVLLAAACFADARAALPLGVEIAVAARAELTGLLAEDPAALALAGLALAPLRRAPIRISADTMLAAFQRDARAFERLLAETATRAALTWSFRLERGSLPALVLPHLAAPGEVVLVGFQRLMRLRGPLVALERPGAPGVQILARVLRDRLRLPLIELPLLPAPAALHALRSLAPAAVIADVTGTEFATPAGLAELIDTARCPLVLRVAPAEG
jgi:hypothetical protein